MDKNEEICRWVAAWIKGELTPEDEAELACWLKQDPKSGVVRYFYYKRESERSFVTLCFFSYSEEVGRAGTLL